MYYTTGFLRREIQELCVLVADVHASTVDVERRDWPPILGLNGAVVVTLTYLRRNRVQCELAETYGVSQATISRAISVMTPLLGKALARYVATADELRPDRQYIVDGTLLPCWSWSDEPGLWSGKHKTTGMVVQVAGTAEGELCWISDPVRGSRHDVYCLDESGALEQMRDHPWIGDKGYVGRDMITPFKNVNGRELLDWQKEFNTDINATRAVIERIIANIKTWRTLHTDYRRPFNTFSATISAVVGLIFYSLS